MVQRLLVTVGRIISVIWRPTFKLPWVIITIPCCNLWVLRHPNLRVIALRTRDTVRGSKKKAWKRHLNRPQSWRNTGVACCKHHDAQAIVFNPGSSLLAEPFHAAVCSTIDCGYSIRQRIYSTGRDPISRGYLLIELQTT